MNGFRICIKVITMVLQLMAVPGKVKMAPFGFSGAVAGEALSMSVGRHFAMATTLTFAVTMSVSVF